MESLIYLLIIMVCFNFLLKQTFRKWWSVITIAIIAALFSGFMWHFAIEQSKSQIAEWLSDTSLMLDVAVILSIEVFLHIAFCISACDKSSLIYRILRWFPGVLIFPVLFFLLTALIFSLPGVSFAAIAWLFAGVVLILIPLGRILLVRLLPEEEIRLEVLFMTNVLIAVLGIIATVNGRTAVEGIDEVNWRALLAFLAIIAICGAVGLLISFRNRRKSRIIRENKHTIL